MNFLFVQYHLYGQIFQHSHQHKKFRRDKSDKKNTKESKRKQHLVAQWTHTQVCLVRDRDSYTGAHTGKRTGFHSAFLYADICMEKDPVTSDCKRSAEAVSSCAVPIIPQRELGCLKASIAFLHLSSPLITRPGWGFYVYRTLWLQSELNSRLVSLKKNKNKQRQNQDLLIPATDFWLVTKSF